MMAYSSHEELPDTNSKNTKEIIPQKNFDFAIRNQSKEDISVPNTPELKIRESDKSHRKPFFNDKYIRRKNSLSRADSLKFDTAVDNISISDHLSNMKQYHSNNCSSIGMSDVQDINNSIMDKKKNSLSKNYLLQPVTKAGISYDKYYANLKRKYITFEKKNGLKNLD